MLTYRQDGEKWRVKMKKWYNVELNKSEWALIRPILKSLDCTYEVSGVDATSGVHIEIYCTPDVASAINAEIDNL